MIIMLFVYLYFRAFVHSRLRRRICSGIWPFLATDLDRSQLFEMGFVQSATTMIGLLWVLILAFFFFIELSSTEI